MRLLTAIPSAVVLISIASAPARCTETRQAAATIDVTKNGARISKRGADKRQPGLGRRRRRSRYRRDRRAKRRVRHASVAL
jgi:hypothetical protein